MKRHDYKYHIFLSHNGAQKEWTRRLAERLRQENLSVFFDEDSIKLGEDILFAIESGLKLSRHVLLILSPEAIKSKWVALEYSASLYKDPSAAERVLIPILRKDCDIPLVLGRLKYLDARDEDFERQLRHLLNGIELVDINSTSVNRQNSDREIQMSHYHKNYQASRGLCISSPIPIDSEMIYIEREADIQARRVIEENDLIVIYGPRKTGKTSLLYRAKKYALNLNRKVGYIDFQMFGSGTNAPQLYFSLCKELHSEVQGKKTRC